MNIIHAVSETGVWKWVIVYKTQVIFNFFYVNFLITYLNIKILIENAV